VVSEQRGRTEFRSGGDGDREPDPLRCEGVAFQGIHQGPRSP